MFNLEKEIRQWKKSLRKGKSFEDGLIEELESHLRDEIDVCMSEGLTEKKAFDKSSKKIGELSSFEKEYEKNNIPDFDINRPWQSRFYFSSLFPNYLKTALRNIKRSKGFSIINILGLSISLAAFALFALKSGIHLNADKFHGKADRIYGVIQTIENANKEEKHTAFLPATVLPELMSQFPEIEEGARIINAGKIRVKRGDNLFYENFGYYVDNNFLNIFDFNLTAGDRSTALSNPHSIIISEKLAEKYFGNENPIGKTMLIENGQELFVTGVSESVSKLSSLRYDFLIPMEIMPDYNERINSWTDNSSTTFLLLKEGHTKTDLGTMMDSFVNKYWNPENDAVQDLYLLPLTDFRLYSDHISSIMRATRLTNVILILAFGGLLLLVACINFINLSIARHMHRAKEIGMRKVLGASRLQIIKQFLTESIVLSLISFAGAVIIYEFVHPVLSFYDSNMTMFGASSNVSNSIFNYPLLILYMVIASLAAGLFSGLFPVLHISSLMPVDSLKGSSFTGKYRRRGTKLLIVVQFFISLMIIVFSRMFDAQFDHWINNSDFGYNKEKIEIIQIPDEAGAKRQLFMNELANYPEVINVSASQNTPGLWSSREYAKLPTEEEDQSISIHTYGVDYNFTEVLSMKIISGRSFNKDFIDNENIVINKSAVERFKFGNPIGEQLEIKNKLYTIIGVTEDFLFNDIGFEMSPAILYLTKNNINYILVKLSNEMDEETNTLFKEKWSAFFPALPFESYSMDGNFKEMMSMGTTIIDVISIIGYLAVAFSYIGLIGLVSFMVARMTKEISIRKVLGASAVNIMKKVIKEFIVLVLLANILAVPLIYFLWDKLAQTGLLYLRDMDTPLIVFIVLTTIAAAVIIIASRIYSTARINPSRFPEMRIVKNNCVLSFQRN